jgi:hypothetical protein
MSVFPYYMPGAFAVPEIAYLSAATRSATVAIAPGFSGTASLQRSTVSGSGFVEISDSDDPAWLTDGDGNYLYSDTGLTAGVRYYYRVVDDNGTSAEASAVPFAPLEWSPVVSGAEATRIRDQGLVVYFELESADIANYRAYDQPALENVRVAELITLDLRDHATPEDAADALIAAAEAAQTTFETNFPAKTFLWGIRLAAGFGAYYHQTRETFPCIYGHPSDTPSSLLNAEDYCPSKSFTIASSASDTTFVIDGAGQTEAASFETGYFDGPFAYVTIDSETKEVDTYDSGTGTFTVTSAFTVPRTGTAVFVRNRSTSGHQWSPPPYMTNGKTAVAAWMDDFIVRLTSQWPGGLAAPTLPFPLSMIGTEEEWQSSLTAWKDNYSVGESPLEVMLDDALADTETISTGYTLTTWDTAFRAFSFPVTTGQFSPESYVARDYYTNLFCNALASAYEEAVWSKMRAIFPDIFCGNYSLGLAGTAASPARLQPGAPSTLAGDTPNTGFANAISFLPDMYGSVLPMTQAAITGTPTTAYTEWNDDDIGWQVLVAWYSLYSVSIEELGAAEAVFVAATMAYVTQQAQAVAAALPGVNKGAFLQIGPYSNNGAISADYTHPDAALDLPDGYFEPAQWGTIISRLLENGVNHLVVFAPDWPDDRAEYFEALGATDAEFYEPSVGGGMGRVGGRINRISRISRLG